MAGMRATVTRASRKICPQRRDGPGHRPVFLHDGAEKENQLQTDHKLEILRIQESLQDAFPDAGRGKTEQKPEDDRANQQGQTQSHFQPDQEDDPDEDEKDFQKIRHKKKT